jgi:hypothetical protein
MPPSPDSISLGIILALPTNLLAFLTANRLRSRHQAAGANRVVEEGNGPCRGSRRPPTVQMTAIRSATRSAVHVMRGEKHGHVLVAAVPADEFPDLVAGLRVEPGSRLVEEQDARPVLQRAGDSGEQVCAETGRMRTLRLPGSSDEESTCAIGPARRNFRGSRVGGNRNFPYEDADRDFNRQ